MCSYLHDFDHCAGAPDAVICIASALCGQSATGRSYQHKNCQRRAKRAPGRQGRATKTDSVRSSRYEPFPRVSSRRLHSQLRIPAPRSASPCWRRPRAVVCAASGAAARRTQCAASASRCEIAHIQRFEPDSSCFRVGCTASCVSPPRARPRRVGGDRGHSFAPLAVLLRGVLIAPPLLLGAKSRIFIGSSPIPRVSASAAQPVAHPRPALGLAVLAVTEGIRLRRWWCCRNAYSLRCLFFSVPNRADSAGTSPIPRVSAPAARPAVHSRPALGLAVLAATEGIRLRR